MNIQDSEVLIADFVKSGIKIPIMLVGGMGIGKSYAFKNVAKALNVKYVDLRLAQMEPGEITGIPYREGNVQKWSKPEWWPENGTKGILVLEEVNRAPTDVRQAIFQLLNEYRINTHVLPDTWMIGIAINPDNGNYQVESLDKAMLRRCLVIHSETTVNSWKEWAKEKVNNHIYSFIETHPDMLFKPEKFSVEQEYNPDSYRMLNEIMGKLDIFKYSQNMRFELLKGLLGKECSMAFIAHMEKEEKFIDAKDLFSDYEKLSKMALKQSNDKMNQTVESVYEYVNSLKLDKVTKELSMNFCDFFEKIKPEFQKILEMNLEYYVREKKSDPIPEKEEKPINRMYIVYPESASRMLKILENLLAIEKKSEKK